MTEYVSPENHANPDAGKRETYGAALCGLRLPEAILEIVGQRPGVTRSQIASALDRSLVYVASKVKALLDDGALATVQLPPPDEAAGYGYVGRPPMGLYLPADAPPAYEYPNGKKAKAARRAQ